MPNSNIETISISNEIIPGNTYTLNHDEFIYKVIEPSKMIVFRVVGNNCSLSLYNPSNGKKIDFVNDMPIYIGEDAGECEVHITSTTNNPNEEPGTILINGQDKGTSLIKKTVSELLNGYLKDYGDDKNRYRCIIKANPPVATGEVVLPNVLNPYSFTVPQGVTSVNINTYRENNGPITITVGVTPGKTYKVSSTKYTLFGRTKVIIGSEFKTWFEFGQIQSLSSANISNFHAAMAWPGSPNPNIEDY